MRAVKLFKAGSFYPEAITSVYTADPTLREQNFGAQYAKLMASGFQWADFWKKHLEPTGNFEVYEAIWNAEPLQKVWAAENGVSYNPHRWSEDILFEQVRHFQPDVFFTHGAILVSAQFLKALRQEFPKILVCGYDGVARNKIEVFAPMNIVFSCLGSTVDFYMNNGIKSELFKLGYEDSLNERLGNGGLKYDCSFAGGLFLGEKGHHHRVKSLCALADKVSLRLHLRCPDNWQYLKSRGRRLLQGAPKDALIRPFTEFPNLYKLNKINHPPLFGLEMLRLFHQSKTTLNIHIDAAGNSAANFRLFEATGAGACLVTDWKPNLKELFEVDREIVSFRSVEECVEKVQYLLEHETERASIAAAGQQRTLRHHRLRDSILTAGRFILNSI